MLKLVKLCFKNLEGERMLKRVGRERCINSTIY